ncbi:GNAT family N-acetyltransferase [Photobacterium jeanii]|nr:GNAT family N-acetyltransferase [Photobacterium jeanii]
MIRAMTAKDTQAGIRLIREAISQCVTTNLDEADDLAACCVEEMLTSLLSAAIEPDIHLAYEVDEQVVGLLLLKHPHRLSNLFVSPCYHHQGIAQALIQRAVEMTYLRYPDAVITLNSSTYAQGFYRAVGFEQTGEGELHPGGCIPFQLSVARYIDNLPASH